MSESGGAIAKNFLRQAVTRQAVTWSPMLGSIGFVSVTL